MWALTAAVIALEIPYPLVHGSARDALTVATVLVFAAASVTHAAVAGSISRGLLLLVVVGILGFVAEVIGVHTGVPFGRYHYTGGLGPTLLGVPLVIALAWVMMAHPAASVAARITSGPSRIAIAAVALASWDVFLDPQMVHAGHWRWSDPTPHLPGVGDVPLTNFAGWLLVALLVMVALHAATRAEPMHDDRPALVLWLWTWWSSALANVAFFHRPAVAAWGFAAMASAGVPLLRSMAAR